MITDHPPPITHEKLPPPLFALSSVFFAGCGPNYAYEQSFDIPGQDWRSGDTLNFEFRMEDTLRIYNLYLEVTHQRDYGFQNLYTRIYTRFPNGERLSEQISLELGNKAGEWFGNCGGKTCTLRIPIQQGAYFSQAGSYLITVEQYMRKDPLPGVVRVGFLLEETEDKRGG